MAEPDFEGAKKKAFDLHYSAKERLENFKIRLGQAEDKFWSVQMECYMKRIDECVDDHNARFLKLHDLNRRKNLFGEMCYENCSKINAPDRYDKIKKMEDLNKVREYLDCLTWIHLGCLVWRLLV